MIHPHIVFQILTYRMSTGFSFGFQMLGFQRADFRAKLDDDLLNII